MMKCFRHQASELTPWPDKTDMVDAAKLITACSIATRTFLHVCVEAQTQIALSNGGNPPSPSCSEIILLGAGREIDCAVDSEKLGYETCK
jgi:hypothetical protein